MAYDNRTHQCEDGDSSCAPRDVGDNNCADEEGLAECGGGNDRRTIPYNARFGQWRGMMITYMSSERVLAAIQAAPF